MNATMFMAQYLGPILFLISVAMLINMQSIRKAAEKISKESMLISAWIMGVFGLIFGVMLVMLHNSRGSVAEVLVSLIGWLTVIKSLVRLFAAQYVMDYAMKFLKNDTAMIASLVIGALYGVALIYIGFLAY